MIASSGKMIAAGVLLHLDDAGLLDIDAVRAKSGDMADIFFEPGAGRLMAILDAVLVAPLRDQAKLPPGDWSDRFTPDVIDRAGVALWRAVLEFLYRRNAGPVRVMLDEFLAGKE